jgi:hypothetical protein
MILDGDRFSFEDALSLPIHNPLESSTGPSSGTSQAVPATEDKIAFLDPIFAGDELAMIPRMASITSSIINHSFPPPVMKYETIPVYSCTSTSAPRREFYLNFERMKPLAPVPKQAQQPLQQ